MSNDLPPILMGAGGLTGRQQIVRVPDLVEPDEDGNYPSNQPSKAIPPNCLRMLSSPLAEGRGGGCAVGCPGRQRDGGCLCDVVRAANEQGVDWLFDVQLDQYGNQWWTYAGPPLAGMDLLALNVRPPGPAVGDRYECGACGALRRYAAAPCEHCGAAA